MSAQDSAAGIDVEPERVASWMTESPSAQVIDVREQYERDAGYIAGSRHIELARLTAEADSIERERPVIFYCRAGSRSAMAAQALRAAGFEAYSMVGGLVRWDREGRPLSPEGGEVAKH
ncbi:MAG: rhodanese-like domain-containing protein [Solirubrobacteraceae bacterium]|jgi:rhodanese-related sulfurtransferase